MNGMRSMFTGLFKNHSSWPQNVINFCRNSQGLGDNKFINKHASKIHGFMFVASISIIIQEVIGVFLLLKGGHYTLVRLVLHLQYFGFFCFICFMSYTLYVHRLKISECIRKAGPTLSCYNGRDLTSLKYFVVGFSVSVYMILSWTIIITPIDRFILHPRPDPGFVIFPLWYPFDIFSSRVWFWFAYWFEFFTFSYGAHGKSCMACIYYYTWMCAEVRFYALGRFLETIAHGKDEKLSITGRKLRPEQSSNQGANTMTNYPLTSQSNSIVVVQDTKESNLDKLKRGMEDWNILRR